MQIDLAGQTVDALLDRHFGFGDAVVRSVELRFPFRGESTATIEIEAGEAEPKGKWCRMRFCMIGLGDFRFDQVNVALHVLDGMDITMVGDQVLILLDPDLYFSENGRRIRGETDPMTSKFWFKAKRVNLEYLELDV